MKELDHYSDNLRIALKCLRKLEQVVVQLHKNQELDLDAVELLLDLCEDAEEHIRCAVKLVK